MKRAIALCNLLACTSAPPPSFANRVACDQPPARLEVYRGGDFIERAHVHASIDGRDELLLVDTGAKRALAGFRPLDGPEDPNDVLRARIECRDVSGSRFRHIAEPSSKGRVVGLIGAAFFFDDVIELDFAAGKMRRLSGAPAASADYYRAPIELRSGLIVVSAVVDGKDTELLLDTGVWSLQLVQPDLDDRDADWRSKDVYGHPLRFVTGHSRLTLGDAPARDVPSARTREFAMFTRHGLGPGVTGMLGISSFRAEKIVFDVPHRTVWFSKS